MRLAYGLSCFCHHIGDNIFPLLLPTSDFREEPGNLVNSLAASQFSTLTCHPTAGDKGLEVLLWGPF
jgi:hypothetical protein